MLYDDQEHESEKKVDRRHQRRMAMVQALFIDEFAGQSWADVDWEYDQEQLEQIRQHKAAYDQEIVAVAKERPLAELPRIDLAILRLMLHESKTKDTPVKVLIDEGVELAKDFGGENSYAFVNAVLEKMLLTENEAESASNQPAAEQPLATEQEKQNG